jgi:hypothetical protein
MRYPFPIDWVKKIAMDQDVRRKNIRGESKIPPDEKMYPAIIEITATIT